MGGSSGSLNTAGPAQPPLRTANTKGEGTRDIQLTELSQQHTRYNESLVPHQPHTSLLEKKRTP